jgi:hypothetical protein
MAVMAIGVIASGVGLALLTIAFLRFLQGGRAWLAGLVRTARRREQLVQLLADPAVQWLPCHALGCGHMSTPHHPDRDGALRCEACGTPAVR